MRKLAESQMAVLATEKSAFSMQDSLYMIATPNLTQNFFIGPLKT